MEKSKRNNQGGITRWKKGQSGNPAGRPKRDLVVPEILRAIGQEKDTKTKKSRLEALMQSVWKRAEAGEEWAVKLILERTEGKVPDRMQLDQRSEEINVDALLVMVKGQVEA